MSSDETLGTDKNYTLKNVRKDRLMSEVYIFVPVFLTRDVNKNRNSDQVLSAEEDK